MQKISKSPFYRSKVSSNNIMLDVIIALLPVSIMAVVRFGLRALVMMVLSVGFAVLFEYISNLVKKENISIGDLSACVTGLLLGLSFPVTVPLWVIIVADFIAIVLIKQLAGGIGKNTFNPAVFARIFMKIIATPLVTNWISPLPDAISAATPLEFIGNGSKVVGSSAPIIRDLFFGQIGGNIGEVVKWAIILGYLWLVFRKTINPWQPLATLLGLFLSTLLFSQSDYYFASYHILSGTAMFAAVFMVTDYTSGPVNYRAKIYYGLSIGILTGIIRHLFDLPGGIGIAILTMNLISPLFDQLFRPKVFGFRNQTSAFNTDH